MKDALESELTGWGGTSLSAAKGVVFSPTTPFAALRDVPPFLPNEPRQIQL
jgi:hypothetical protein